MIGASARPRQDVVNFHDTEGKVRTTARADAFLLTVEAMPVGPVVRQITKIRPDGRTVQRCWATEQPAPPVSPNPVSD